MGAFHYLDPSVFFNAASLAADNTNESLVCVQLLTGLREARVLVIWQAGLVRHVRFYFRNSGLEAVAPPLLLRLLSVVLATSTCAVAPVKSSYTFWQTPFLSSTYVTRPGNRPNAALGTANALRTLSPIVLFQEARQVSV